MAMTPEERGFLVAKVGNAVFAAQGNEQRLGTMVRQISQLAPIDQGFFFVTIGAKATEDVLAARLALLALDLPAVIKQLTEAGVAAMRDAAAEVPGFGPVATVLDKGAALGEREIRLLRAKTATVLGILSMLNDRLEAKKLPQQRLSAFELAAEQIESLGESSLAVRLDRFNKLTWDPAREVLLEADFEAAGNNFQLRLSEDQIRALCDPGAFGSRQEGGTARVSEAMLSRTALNLVKRLCLVTRNVLMYPPDHPGLPPAFESLRQGVLNTLGDKDMITLTILGSELLVDEVKIRKEDKFKSDFVRICDERNISSLTLRREISVGDLKTLVYCFNEAPRILKDKGGLRKVLEKANIKGIGVDQFRYGIVADDGTIQTSQVGMSVVSDEKMLEDVIYSHLVERMKSGDQDLSGVSTDQLGGFFRDLVSNPNQDKRVALARVLLSFDPTLFERGFLANPELRKELSWSAARKTLDMMHESLGHEKTDEREHALETINHLMDIAIVRNKDTAIEQTQLRLCRYIAMEEDDGELLRAAGRVLATMATTFLRRGRMETGARFVRMLRQLADGAAEMAVPPARKKKVGEAISVVLQEISGEEDVMDGLVESMCSQDASVARTAEQMLDDLRNNTVIDRLIRLFLQSERAVRVKAHKTLARVAEQALPSITYQIETLSQRAHATRDATGALAKDSWYILRNCISLLGDIRGAAAGPMLARLGSDPDPRVRREALHILMRCAPAEARRVAAGMTRDPNADARAAALRAVGTLRVTTVTDELIDLFCRQRQHRDLIVAALERIGDEKAVVFLCEALAAMGKRRHVGSGRTFPVDGPLVLAAVRALGNIGGPIATEVLEMYVRYWSSGLRRAFFRPMRGFPFKAAVAAARDALAQAQGHAVPSAPAGEAAPEEAPAAEG